MIQLTEDGEIDMAHLVNNPTLEAIQEAMRIAWDQGHASGVDVGHATSCGERIEPPRNPYSTIKRKEPRR